MAGLGGRSGRVDQRPARRDPDSGLNRSCSRVRIEITGSLTCRSTGVGNTDVSRPNPFTWTSGGEPLARLCSQYVGTAFK